MINRPGRYHLNGYHPNDPIYIEQLSRYDEFLDRYCDLARELRICIVPGTILKRQPHDSETNASSGPVFSDEHGSYTISNVANFISEQGSVLGSYAKKNLWGPERLHQSPGHEKHVAINTSLGRIGMLICWDLAFPEAFRELIRDGAKIIIVPTCWTLDESSAYGLALNSNYEALIINSMVTARCFENTCAVVFANAGGPPDTYIGLSQVAMPFTGPICRVLDHSEGVLIVDIEPEVLKQAELNYKVREDIARVDWHYR